MEMLQLVVFLAVILVARLRGGMLRNFAALRLNWIWLVLLSLLLQRLIFPGFLEQALVRVGTIPLYVLSMVLLVVWVWRNLHIPGIVLTVSGLLMNTAAIVVNGGLMPVDPLAAEYAGTLAAYSEPVHNNSHATTEGVQLWLLTDIFPVPNGIPFANVFSLGDILLTVGISTLAYQTIRYGSRPSAPEQVPTTEPGPAPVSERTL
jgi:hypothetical protein